MTFAFDLISDLHIETWDSFDWTGQPTSPYCVVAGDIARDRNVVAETLKHLGQCYQAVFYIDGNDEHRYYLDDISASYQDLTQVISNIDNVIYLQDNVVIINGVAILATNGWWTYDFDPLIDYEQSQLWYQQYVNCSSSSAIDINGIAYHDAAYIVNSIEKLQTHQDVKKIVIVSHTVPAPWLTEHDVNLVNTWRYNCLGNSHLQLSLNEDTENKIHTWCFGHYHQGVDRDLNGIRYVNNCRGRGDTPWSQTAYYPKRIEIAF
jgi:UDP-2,3-diacylglucosamine pyrophosphatase LpxH